MDADADIVSHGIVDLDPKLEFLRPTLKRWWFVHRRYCKEFEFKESMYWCNERSNVGALSAAAWLARTLALEEYPHETKERGKTVRGKPDLYLRNPRQNKEAFLECKLHWWGFVSKPDTELRHIAELSDLACEQALQRKDRDISLAIGAVFVVPALLKGHEFGRGEVKKIQDECLHGGMAWYLPKEAAVMREMDAAKRMRSYPGIVLLLRIAGKQRSGSIHKSST